MEAKRLVLYDDGRGSIEKTVNTHSKVVRSVSLREYYEIDKTLNIIRHNNYKRVALQFPDDLLDDSTPVADILSIEGNTKVFILADTSYGSENVDEVAAGHIDAEFIVHYGRATITSTGRLPVLYVFGKSILDIDDLTEKFCDEFKTEDHVIIFYDCEYEYISEDIKKKLDLKGNFNRVFVTKMKNDNMMFNNDLKSENTLELNKDFENIFTFSGRYLDHPLEHPKEKYKILFIGDVNPTLTNLVMAFNQSKVYRYDPKKKKLSPESLAVNRLLQQRYFMIEKAKDANIIGILVGTLVGPKYLEMLDYLRKIISEARKKYYTIVIGKINLPKMANFYEIDIFVLVSGMDSSLVDPREFYKPILTPFELEIALVRGKTWTTEYLIDFNEVLKNKENKTEEDSSDDDTHRVSLFGGHVTINPKAKRNKNEPSQALTTKEWQLEKYNATQFFLQRTFKGLEQKIGETPVTTAVEGRTGIPGTGYQDEQNLATSTPTTTVTTTTSTPPTTTPPPTTPTTTTITPTPPTTTTITTPPPTTTVTITTTTAEDTNATIKQPVEEEKGIYEIMGDWEDFSSDDEENLKTNK